MNPYLRTLMLILLLGALALPGLAPAAHAASGSASPTVAGPGVRVHFTATGFRPGERVDLWATPPGGVARPRYPSVVADAGGAIIWSWDVAPGDPNGEWTMTARGVTSNVLLAIPFTVTGSSPLPDPISVAPSSGAPGTAFEFQASGLTPGRRVAAWLVDPGGASRDLTPGKDPNLVPDARGELRWRWTAPDDARGGVWQMVVRDLQTSREIIARFTIIAPAAPVPERSVTPPSGAPGTVFSITIGGFTPGEQVGSWLTTPDGRAVDATPYLIADRNGVVTWRWASPASAQAGVWQAVSRGRDSRVEVAIPFTVTGANPAPAGPPPPGGQVIPAAGTPGATFTFVVTGFNSIEEVGYWPTRPDGTVDDTKRTPVRADGDGRVTLAWQAPARAPSGMWTMSFRGLASRREVQIAFVIAADPPAAASVNPLSGPPGTTFTFQARGFNAIERVDTWLERPDGVIVAGPPDIRATPEGAVTWTWTAPAASIGGQWTMVARGQDTRKIERITFSITNGATPAPAAGVTPEEGSIGTTFTFSASGFKDGEFAGYWLNRPDGSIERFDRELRANAKGVITWTYTVPEGAQRGLYVMAIRSSQNDNVNNDVSHAIRFIVR